MPKFMKNGQIVGEVTINGKTYELLQLNRAVWIIDGSKDVSNGTQFRTREALMRKHPNAKFNKGD